MAISGTTVMRELLEFSYIGLLFAANALLLCLGCSAFLYFCYRRVRVKGYRPPAAAAIILIAVVVGITLTVLRKPNQNSTYSRFFFDYFWVPLLLSTIAMGILIFILPRRRNRVFGQRRVRFPFVGVGRALIGFGLALIAVAVVLLACGKESGSLVVAAVAFTLVASPTRASLDSARAARRVDPAGRRSSGEGFQTISRMMKKILGHL
jgi:hypothetical protein